MKKINFLLIALVLSACSPQVTVTSQVTVTLAPPTIIPTPTLHPKFIELQNLINDSSERFTLLPDGTLEETTADGGRKIVPNLYVDQNGIINIIFNNERVAIDQSQITFDDEKGLTIDSYELENGEWVEAKETVILGGVTLTLDENGVVTEMSVEGNYTDEQKAEKLGAVDPTNWGFEEGEAQIVQEGVQLYITPAGEPETKIARWFYGAGDWEWQWDELEKFSGGNPVFEVAKLWEMNGVNEVDRDGAQRDSVLIDNFVSSDQTVKNKGYKSQAIYLVSEDGQMAVGAVLLSKVQVDTPKIAESGEVDGFVYFMTRDGELVRMRVSNLTLRIRYWR